MDIPTLNFRDFTSGTQFQKDTFCSNLYASLSTLGFVKIKNHTIPDEILDQVFDWVCHSRPDKPHTMLNIHIYAPEQALLRPTPRIQDPRCPSSPSKPAPRLELCWTGKALGHPAGESRVRSQSTVPLKSGFGTCHAKWNVNRSRSPSTLAPRTTPSIPTSSQTIPSSQASDHSWSPSTRNAKPCI